MRCDAMRRGAMRRSRARREGHGRRHAIARFWGFASVVAQPAMGGDAWRGARARTVTRWMHRMRVIVCDFGARARRSRGARTRGRVRDDGNLD
jgi:hypothetical protein